MPVNVMSSSGAQTTPTGTIGADSAQADLAAVILDGSGISDAITYLWSIVVDEDADTSGYTSATAPVAPTDASTIATPDGPGVYTLSCVATGPGGTTTFRRKVVVSAARPTVSVSSAAPQRNLARVTLGSSVTGTGTALAWTLTRVDESGAADKTALLSSTTAASPTFDPERFDAVYVAALTVTDQWGQTATAKQTVRIGQPVVGVHSTDSTAGTAT